MNHYYSNDILSGAKTLWKNDLIKNLFNNDPDSINTKFAIDLKYENIPSSLYKYRHFETKLLNPLEILKSGKIHLSAPTSFNDPFDCASQLIPGNIDQKFILESNPGLYKKRFNLSDKEFNGLMTSNNVIKDICRLVLRKLEQNNKKPPRTDYIKECEKIVKETSIWSSDKLRDSINIASFSETNESILMWSHYAHNHEGFCIEYDFKKLGINHHLTRFIFPVIYSQNVFDIGKSLSSSKKEFQDVMLNYSEGIEITDDYDESDVQMTKLKFNNMLLFQSALNKSEEWTYEKEWRYLFKNENPLEKKYFFLPKPKAVYLGAKIKEDNLDKILRIAQNRDFEVFQMEKESTKFTLKPNKIW